MLFISKFRFDLVFQQQIFIPQGQPAGMPARIYQKRIQTEAYLLYYLLLYVSYTITLITLRYQQNNYNYIMPQITLLLIGYAT